MSVNTRDLPAVPDLDDPGLYHFCSIEEKLRSEMSDARDFELRDCVRTTNFQIPASILKPSADQTAPLLRLPPEMLLLIMSHATPNAAVAMALSCRHLLRVSSLLKSVPVPVLAAHRRPWRRLDEALRGTELCVCPRAENLLRKLQPLTSQTKRPSRAYNLCVDCLHVLPTNRTYWNRKLRSTKRRLRDVTPRGVTPVLFKGWEVQWRSSEKWFGTKVKVQCPTCSVGEWAFDQTIRDYVRTTTAVTPETWIKTLVETP